MHGRRICVCKLKSHSDNDPIHTGANIPGKPRQFCVHLGGPLYFFQRLAEVAARGYKGFVFEEERRAEVAAAL